ncbi:MAG: hypothetical protein QG556_381, partial [Pseudomonadota bacterium]|nr:hypothetical protein [Pseudomonadota bacterium]
LDTDKFLYGADIDMNKFNSSQDLQKQQLQAQENQMRNAYLTDLQKYAKNFGLQAGQFGIQKAQTLSQMGVSRGNTRTQGQQQQAGFLGMQQAGAMAPYGYGQQYYGGTATLEGPKGNNVFQDVMGGIGTLGGVASGIVGAAYGK